MSKLAIVGTSKLENEQERSDAIKIIETVLEAPDEIITGDADGVDYFVRCFSQIKPTLVIKAIEKKWEGKYGFKARNSMIAAECDELVCITTKTKTRKCYHCNADHQRTGGCWTMKEAKRLGKITRLYVV
ncbi:MAG: hypothetical protein ACE5H1_02780 [Thermodesulfobacteriota bacterium]